MPAVVINVTEADDRRDVVHRAVQALVEGQLVAFPTETNYCLAAGALNPQAVARFRAFSHPLLGDPWLALRSSEESWDYVGDLSSLGKRLTRRCWPGPVTLEFPNRVDDGRFSDSAAAGLPKETYTALTAADHWLPIRVTGHRLLGEVLQMVVGPAVACDLQQADASRPGEPVPIREVAQLAGQISDQPVLVLDDGPCRFGGSASVVRVAGDEFSLVKSGVVMEQTLRRLASLIIVFVCTGNTCRSPMAELLARKLLAERLACGMDQLEQQGVIVMSAGLAAMTGGGPSREAVEVMQQRGLDLSSHGSQPLTDQMIRQADLLLVMTRGHRQAIVAEYPEVAERVHLVCTDGRDVSDPIGGPVQMYEATASQIEGHLRKWIDQLPLGPGGSAGQTDPPPAD